MLLATTLRDEIGKDMRKLISDKWKLLHTQTRIPAKVLPGISKCFSFRLRSVSVGDSHLNILTP